MTKKYLEIQALIWNPINRNRNILDRGVSFHSSLEELEQYAQRISSQNDATMYEVHRQIVKTNSHPFAQMLRNKGTLFVDLEHKLYLNEYHYLVNVPGQIMQKSGQTMSEERFLEYLSFSKEILKKKLD